MCSVNLRRWNSGRTSVALLALTSLLIGCQGCTSDPPEVPPPHNRQYITYDGQFVGHIKPVPPPVGPNGKRIVPDYPVLWVVDGGKAEQTEGEYDVHTFRLDFDEKQALTEAMLPYPLMTESTHQIIVHRGPPPDDFSHPQINDGERAFPIAHCINNECPKYQKVENGQLFPVPPGEEAVCPSCGQSNTMDFQMPQHRDMLDVMTRQQSQ